MEGERTVEQLKLTALSRTQGRSEGGRDRGNGSRTELRARFQKSLLEKARVFSECRSLKMEILITHVSCRRGVRRRAPPRSPRSRSSGGDASILLASRGEFRRFTLAGGRQATRRRMIKMRRTTVVLARGWEERRTCRHRERVKKKFPPTRRREIAFHEAPQRAEGPAWRPVDREVHASGSIVFIKINTNTSSSRIFDSSYSCLIR